MLQNIPIPPPIDQIFTQLIYDAQLKIHIKTNGKRMNSRSSYFNTDSFVKILLLKLESRPPFYCAKHSPVMHVSRFLPAMNRCEHTQPTQPNHTKTATP